MNNALKTFLPLIILCALGLIFMAATYVAPSEIKNRDIALSERRAQHILYGDERGGGHMFGTGAPCKSEFPADWGSHRILEATKQIAANDNLDWERQGNGYYVAEKLEDGVKIRVVLDGQKRNIITSYPTNTKRNPCPANDN